MESHKSYMIHIKVIRSISDYGWYAFVSSQGEESARHGWSIEEALESLLDEFENDVKFSWS